MDWNPLVAAVAAAIPTLVVVLRNSTVLRRVEHQTNSRLSSALAEIAYLKAHVASLEARMAVVAPERRGEP